MTLFSMILRLVRNGILGKPAGEGLPTSPEKYGMPLSEPRAKERTEGVLRAFFTGMERAARRPWSVTPEPEGTPPLFHPFYWEGAAMGHTLARLATFRPAPAVLRGEPYSLMRAIGVGFALGVLPFCRPAGLARAARRCGNIGLLVPDGFGFATGMFRWRGSVGTTVKRLEKLDGLERSAALNGLGRSLWFRFMDRPSEGLREMRGSKDLLPLVGGFGLAAAFTFTDELSRGYDLAASLPADEKRWFEKGMRIALFVRRHHQEPFLREILLEQGEEIQRRAGEDLKVAYEAYAATCEDTLYIPRFHERCLLGPAQE